MDQPKYHIDVFWSDEDGGYIANVPNLEYCAAFGETYEEALREVQVAMDLHLDTLRELGRPIPDPGSRRVIGVSSGLSGTGRSIQIIEGNVVSSVDDVSAEVVEAVDSVVESVGQAMEGQISGEASRMSGGEVEVRAARRRRRQ